MATTLDGATVAQILYQAGFRGQDLVAMVGIARRESGWQPSAHRSDQPKHLLSGDMGLLQINYSHWGWIQSELGLTSKQQLFDPVVNARVAKALYDKDGLNPWAMGDNGWQGGGDPFRGVNMDAAADAVNRAQAQGLLATNDYYVPGVPGLGSSTGSPYVYTGDLPEYTPSPYAQSDMTGGMVQSEPVGPVSLPQDGRLVSFGGWPAVLFEPAPGVFISFSLGGVDANYDPSQLEQISIGEWEQMQVVDGGLAWELDGMRSFGDFWENLVKQVFGDHNPAAQDAGVLRVLAEKAARPDMSLEELDNRLQETRWFQTRTEEQLTWNDLSEAERNQRREETRALMLDNVFRFVGQDMQGAEGRSPLIDNYLDDVSSGKMSMSQYVLIVKDYARDVPESPWVRQVRDEEEAQRQRPIDIENTTARIRDQLNDWGLQWTESTMRNWARDIVEKRKSDDDLIESMKSEAEVIYPWKDREVETVVAARPWLETYGRVMEKQGTLQTSKVQRALTMSQTPWEFEQDLKRSDEWMSTKNGQSAVGGAIAEIGRMMGYA